MAGEMKVTIHLMMLTLAAIKEEFTGTAVVKTSNDFSDNVISRKAFPVKTNNRLTYYRTPELQSDQNSAAAYPVGRKRRPNGTNQQLGNEPVRGLMRVCDFSTRPV